MPYQGPRPNQKPSVLACGTPYQRLPDPVLAVRNRLVDLDWSTNTYQDTDLGPTPWRETITNDYQPRC